MTFVAFGVLGLLLVLEAWCIGQLRGRLTRLERRYELSREKHFRTTGVTFP